MQQEEPPERYVEAFVYLLPKPILEARIALCKSCKQSARRSAWRQDLLAAPHRPYFLTQRLTSRLADAQGTRRLHVMDMTKLPATSETMDSRYDAGHTKNVRLASCPS